jgi:Protein of unknown function (DUF3761)
VDGWTGGPERLDYCNARTRTSFGDHVRTSPILTALPIAIALVVIASSANAQAAEKARSQSVCKDGTTSASKGTGTCSGHGGVDSLATAAAKKSAKAAKARAEATKVSGDSGKAAAADSKAKRAESKATKAENKAEHDSTGATAECKDGTYSHAKTAQGRCSSHGGVLKTMKG